MTKLKKLVTAVVLSLCIVFISIAGGLLSLSTTVYAHDGDDHNDDNTSTTTVAATTIENPDFKGDSTTQEPIEPKGWTGSAPSFLSGTHVVKHGVVSLTDFNREKAGFESDETIDNVNKQLAKEENSNALLIHNTRESIYEYTSNEISIPANGYLMLSLEAYTGEFGSGQHASVSFDSPQLNGLHFDINTDNQWKKYTLAIKGFSNRSVSTKLVLSVGSYKTESANGNKIARMAKGFAFFDNINLSYETNQVFAHHFENSFDLSQNGIFKKDNETIFLPKKESSQFNDPSFESINKDVTEPNTNWKVTSGSNVQLFSDYSSEITKNEYKIDDKNLSNPYSPFSNTGKVLTIFSKNNGSATIEAKESNYLNVPRFGYVRFSIWANLLNAKGSPTVSLKATTVPKSVLTAEESSEITSITAQNENNWTGKWGEAVFYIKGSPIEDTKVKLTVSVSNLVGAINFDNVSQETLSGERYTILSENGTKFELKATDDTVANGSFNKFKPRTEKDILSPADNWTVSASDKAIVGIVPLDDYFTSAEFKNERKALGLTSSDLPRQKNNKNNALLINHSQKDSTEITSETITPPADNGKTDDTKVDYNYTIIKVQLSQRLKQNQIAKLKFYSDTYFLGAMDVSNTDTNQSPSFETYAFCVKKTAKFANFTVKIIVGEVGKEVEGSVFVNNVWCGGSTNPISGANKDSDVYKYLNLDLNDTELFTLLNESGKPQAWSLENTAGYNNVSLSMVPRKNRDQAYGSQLNEMMNGATNDYLMYMVANKYTTTSAVRFEDYSFTASGFAKITVRLKTRDFAPGEGARLTLGETELPRINTEHLSKKDVESQDIALSNEYTAKSDKYPNGIYKGFRNYTFFVKTNEEKTSARLKIFIGDGKEASKFRKGSILIESIKIEEGIPENEFKDATDVFEKNDQTNESNYDKLPTNARLAVVGSEKANDDDHVNPNPDVNPKPAFDPWVIPTILFGVVLLLAIAGFMLRHYAPKFSKARDEKKSKRTRGLVSYDRNNKIILPTSKKVDKTKTDEQGDITEKEQDDASYEFDYTAPLVHSSEGIITDEAVATEGNIDATDATSNITDTADDAIDTESESIDLNETDDTQDETTNPTLSAAPSKAESMKKSKKTVTVNAKTHKANKLKEFEKFDSFDD